MLEVIGSIPIGSTIPTRSHAGGMAGMDRAHDVSRDEENRFAASAADWGFGPLFDIVNGF